MKWLEIIVCRILAFGMLTRPTTHSGRHTTYAGRHREN